MVAARLSDIPPLLVVTGASIGFIAGGLAGYQFGVPFAGSALGGVVGWFGTLIPLTAKVGRPEPTPIRSYNTVVPALRIPVVQEDGKAGQFARFGCERQDLELLAFGLATGKPFTDAQWTGPRKPFTVRQFADVRNEMIALGWARWRSPATPQRGAVVTAKGMAVCRGLAGVTPPLPTDRMLMLGRATG